MTTILYNYDGTIFTNLADYTLTVTRTSISLPGKGYRDYAQSIGQDLLWTLQNFSNRNTPKYPIKGQCWYDTVTNSLRLFNGSSWNANDGTIISNTIPLTAPSQGTLWYDTTNLQLNLWNGTNWNILGLTGSAINSDPISNTMTPDNSQIDSIQITDSLGNNHLSFRITVDGIIVAIISKDDLYTPNPLISGFSTISPGINLNTNIVLNVDDETIFRSTKTNLPDADNVRNMGSPFFRFNTVFSNTLFAKTQLLINTLASSNNFETTGNTAFNGIVISNKNAKFIQESSVPIIINSNAITANSINGAIEFDGTNFYFTPANSSTRSAIATGIITTPGSWRWIIYSNSLNNYIAICSPSPTLPIPIGTIISGIIPSTNTSTTVTLQITANGTKNIILLSDGMTSPAIGSLIINHVVQFKWNGSNWLAMNDITAAGTIQYGSSFLPLSGGTMSGQISLPGNPVLNLQTAPKQYVDQQEAVIQSQINALNAKLGQYNPNNYLKLSGGTMNGPIVLPSDPTISLQAATKNYVDTQYSALNPSNYLPLVGGTLTGPVTLPHDPTNGFSIATKQYVDNGLANLLVKTSFFGMGNVKLFETPGTYSYYPSDGVTKAIVILTGGGGAGGANNNYGTIPNSMNGGGGNGATTIMFFANPVTTSQIVVGVGGTVGILPPGSSGSALGNGGVTYFTDSSNKTYSSNGATAANGSHSGTTNSSTAGPSGQFLYSGPTDFIVGAGAGGSSTFNDTYNYPTSTQGGSSFWGPGAADSSAPAVNYGSGGGGGPNLSGSNGAPGVVCIIEFS